jgi:integrase
MRACEIKPLRWEDVDLPNRLLHVRLSKTPAGWRSPTLNTTCLRVLQELRQQAVKLGFAHPTHFVFPWHGRKQAARSHQTHNLVAHGLAISAEGGGTG